MRRILMNGNMYQRELKEFEVKNDMVKLSWCDVDLTTNKSLNSGSIVVHFSKISTYQYSKLESKSLFYLKISENKETIDIMSEEFYNKINNILCRPKR